MSNTTPIIVFLVSSDRNLASWAFFKSVDDLGRKIITSPSLLSEQKFWTGNVISMAARRGLDWDGVSFVWSHMDRILLIRHANGHTCDWRREEEFLSVFSGSEVRQCRDVMFAMLENRELASLREISIADAERDVFDTNTRMPVEHTEKGKRI